MSKVFFGTNKETNERIYLDNPSWDCDWYWGFGYLGNKNCHYHLSSYQQKDLLFTLSDGCHQLITEKRNMHIVDCLKADYDLNPKILKNIWVFCELVLTAYALKESAEVIGRGGSHTTTNPCKDIIINKDEVARINEIALPAIFEQIANIFKEA